MTAPAHGASVSRIRVVIVDDSDTTRRLLAGILASDPRLEVIGTAEDGPSALELVLREKPDVVLMDSHMPRMDGFEATRLIMESHPVPVVICSATTEPDEVETAFRIMEAGAVACVPRPIAPGHHDFNASVQRLVQTVRLMSEVKVVRRWPRRQPAPRTPPATVPAAAARRNPCGSLTVGIGASTGGPPVLQQILAALPKDFPAPILIVQHIAPGFLPGLVDWLNRTSSLQVKIAAHGIVPQPGHVYVAPDGFHLGISADGSLVLAASDRENGLRPAVSHLFQSLAMHCGRRATGVLLTGMGKDGAAQMKLMREAGGTTIAQDRDSSVVHGMPGAAIALGAATHILAADQIAAALIAVANNRATA